MKLSRRSNSTLLVAALLLSTTLRTQAQGQPSVLAPPGSPVGNADGGQLFQLPAPIETLPSQLAPEADAQTVVEVVPVHVPAWYEAAYWFGPEPWDLGFELGLNGTEGINEALSLRTGGHIKRKTENWKFDNSLVYNRNSANNVETQNNALLDVRVDRLLGDSPWTLYFINQDLYDEFQAFDVRVSLNAGVGYQLIDTETINLIGRFGAGSSREFGGPDDRWAQEALFGIDYEHELTKTQRLTAKVDYYPEWEDFEKYRIVTDIGWEIDLDHPSNVSLKLSVLDRYDSTPNGADPNELNYAALLIWGL